MARIKQSSLIVERKFNFDVDGEPLVVHARMGPARAWFNSAESRDSRWLVTDADEPGQILALRVSLG